ncbi:uncharacterized protein LOC131144103 isoform X2 [Malania oleifera]|uniref:uncharacterized protein LOC131144103 isoform X2 n=1 Tax=Malania oleifera TaxID=397392 RepID=UPI0025AE848D|nr:uncharacterized protein LOC131144103 isoform X2 [Malania oleifera]
MIALQHKVTMPRDSEASIQCLQNKGLPFILRCDVNPTGGFPERKEEINAHLGGDVTKSEHLLGNDSLEPHAEYGKPTMQQDSGLWSNCCYDPRKVQQCPSNSFVRQICYCPLDSRCSALNIFSQSQGYPYEFQFQEFQYFVVIDFEATCDKVKNPHPQEIIEFPSVIVSSLTGQLEACFQTYVRPTCNQLLSDFCKDLTGIQQVQVDRGVTLSEALLRHDIWLEKKGIKNTKFAVVTWSDWDCQVMLESECRYKKIQKHPYFNRWINLKVPFREVFGGVRCNLKEAIQLAGLSWQGRAHCGLDDAKNTARLLALLMQRGFKFSITNSLMWESTDHSLSWKHPSFLAHHHHCRLINLNIGQFQSHPCCFCGVKSCKGIVWKPGPKQGRIFFVCGNWTVAGGPCCRYFQWASL